MTPYYEQGGITIYHGDNFIRHDLGTVITEKRAKRDSIAHPTVKPITATRTWLSAVPGSILDPFMGSGTTLIAAKQLGRTAIGIEMSEKYCELAATRLAAVNVGEIAEAA